jgi:dTDP-4-amino-4,6-dideoxygalactose transaminase
MSDPAPSPFPPWPHYEEDEIDAVSAVLRSGKVNYWTGDTVQAFEAAYAEHLGLTRALAVANGTLALEVALGAFEIGPGADVLVPSRSFVASASCVLARGARPVFCDLERDGQVVSAATLEAARTPDTRAVIVVHLSGFVADMPAIMAWAEPHGIVVIEDCAQAHGASLGGTPAGAFGHGAAFSFCQDKILTTGGEGGLFATSDEAAYRRAWSLNQHGKSYEAVFERQHEPGFRWLVETPGTNWRLTALQAAIGLRQLEKLPSWREARTRNAAILREALAPLPGIRWDREPEDMVNAYYRATCYVAPDQSSSRDKIMASLQAGGWPIQSGTCPEIYREKLFQDGGLAPPERLLVARELGETSLWFRVHHTISPEVMAAYAAAAKAAIEAELN